MPVHIRDELRDIVSTITREHLVERFAGASPTRAEINEALADLAARLTVDAKIGAVVVRDRNDPTRSMVHLAASVAAGKGKHDHRNPA